MLNAFSPPTNSIYHFFDRLESKNLIQRKADILICHWLKKNKHLFLRDSRIDLLEIKIVHLVGKNSNSYHFFALPLPLIDLNYIYLPKYLREGDFQKIKDIFPCLQPLLNDQKFRIHWLNHHGQLYTFKMTSEENKSFILENQNKIRKLSFSRIKISKQILPVIFPKLTYLSLSSNYLDDVNVAALSKSHLPSIHELNLSNNKITNKGIEALSCAPWFTTLEKLDLGANRFSHSALPSLLKQILQLKVLDLSWNEIGNQGAIILGRTSSLPKIKELYVNECKITYRRFEFFRLNLKKLEI